MHAINFRLFIEVRIAKVNWYKCVFENFIICSKYLAIVNIMKVNNCKMVWARGYRKLISTNKFGLQCQHYIFQSHGFCGIWNMKAYCVFDLIKKKTSANLFVMLKCKQITTDRYDIVCFVLTVLCHLNIDNIYHSWFKADCNLM